MLAAIGGASLYLLLPSLLAVFAASMLSMAGFEAGRISLCSWQSAPSSSRDRRVAYVLFRRRYGPGPERR